MATKEQFRLTKVLNASQFVERNKKGESRKHVRFVFLNSIHSYE